MDYCDTCKLDTNHGGYDFCPHETKSKLDKALLQIRAYEQRILECRVSSSTEVQKVLDSIEGVIADKRVGQSPKDTCENYRDADGVLHPRFCSEFERNPHPAHSPTCQFYK